VWPEQFTDYLGLVGAQFMAESAEQTGVMSDG